MNRRLYGYDNFSIDKMCKEFGIIEERLDEVYHTLGLKYKHYGKE